MLSKSYVIPSVGVFLFIYFFSIRSDFVIKIVLEVLIRFMWDFPGQIYSAVVSVSEFTYQILFICLFYYFF